MVWAKTYMAVRILGVEFGYTNYANYKNSAE